MKAPISNPDNEAGVNIFSGFTKKEVVYLTVIHALLTRKTDVMTPTLLFEWTDRIVNKIFADPSEGSPK